LRRLPLFADKRRRGRVPQKLELVINKTTVQAIGRRHLCRIAQTRLIE
jgi:hypothetical protein